MTADIEMLPLPKWLLEGFTDPTIERLCDYARANVAHATAAKDAEIEALRAEVVRWKSYYNAAIELKGRAFAERDRLEEALRDARDYVTTALREEREKFSGHEDCSDIPGIEADLHKIDSALRDHDQEGDQ